MGTHMWSSAQVSRRGRRMSLELPPGTVPPVGGRGPLGVPSGGHPPPTGVPPPPPTGLPPIPMNAKDSEFLRGRPDLFYPYLQHQTGGTHPSTQFNNGATPPIIPLMLSISYIVNSAFLLSRMFYAVSASLA